jgi:hypothetical protein
MGGSGGRAVDGKPAQNDDVMLRAVTRATVKEILMQAWRRIVLLVGREGGRASCGTEMKRVQQMGQPDSLPPLPALYGTAAVETQPHQT